MTSREARTGDVNLYFKVIGFGETTLRARNVTQDVRAFEAPVSRCR